MLYLGWKLSDLATLSLIFTVCVCVCVCAGCSSPWLSAAWGRSRPSRWWRAPVPANRVREMPRPSPIPSPHTQLPIHCWHWINWQPQFHCFIFLLNVAGRTTVHGSKEFCFPPLGWKEQEEKCCLKCFFCCKYWKKKNKQRAGKWMNELKFTFG